MTTVAYPAPRVVAACMSCKTCEAATPLYLIYEDGSEPTTETGRRWKWEFIAKHNGDLHDVLQAHWSAP